MGARGNVAILLAIIVVAVSMTGSSSEDTHPCVRECYKGQQPRVCHYKFNVEQYWTMSNLCMGCPFNGTDCGRKACVAADGWRRGIVTINRQLPGPSLQVCQGDEVVVDVLNSLTCGSTSIHWHGMRQHGTPFMDGVPMLTQCPIQPGTSFQYRFTAEDAGTYFYHSHSGHQKDDGVYGSLVVRQPRDVDPNGNLYDHDLPEHVFLVQDWTHESTEDHVIGSQYEPQEIRPMGMLVNGKGKCQEFKDRANNETVYTPMTRFDVDAGKRYRFRVINNGVVSCPIEISVDGHKLTVIASDGNPIHPVLVDSFVIAAGERYDFVLHANKEQKNYWLKAHGLMDCGPPFSGAFQYAILHYNGAQCAPNHEPEGEFSYEAAGRGGDQLNPINTGSGHEGKTTAAEMVDALEDDVSLMEVPDYKVFVGLYHRDIEMADFDPADYPLHHMGRGGSRVTPVNNITFTFPQFPPLTQPEDVTPNTFCNERTLGREHCAKNQCECPQMVEFATNSTVELILVQLGNPPFEVNHPFHLHGHYFRVAGLERLGEATTMEEVRRLDDAGKLKRNLSGAPRKDTVNVPDGGYAILRFYADNPGYWLFHCHISIHFDVGMAMIFKVGSHEEMAKPPSTFGKCGCWK